MIANFEFDIYLYILNNVENLILTKGKIMSTNDDFFAPKGFTFLGRIKSTRFSFLLDKKYNPEKNKKLLSKLTDMLNGYFNPTNNNKFTLSLDPSTKGLTVTVFNEIIKTDEQIENFLKLILRNIIKEL